MSVQTIQDISVGPDLYNEVIAPSELSVLTAAIAAGGKNILHVCGYEGVRNNLSLFKNYPAHAVNFAAAVEGISLSQGKQLFGGKAIIGGFANTANGILYKEQKSRFRQKQKSCLQMQEKQGLSLEQIVRFQRILI